MAELLRPYVQARPDEPAVTDERGVTTWREFAARADRLAGALRGAGLTTGDTIAIHSGNRREYEADLICGSVRNREATLAAGPVASSSVPKHGGRK